MLNILSAIPSPLEQFEISNYLSLDAPVFGYSHISLTNIGLYLTIGAFTVLTLSVLATNFNKVISNSWSLSQESIYATIHSIVVNQINQTKGQIYFPFIYTLFVFILINNLIGMVKRSLQNNNIFITNIPYIKTPKVRTYSTSASASTPISPRYNFKNNSYYLHPYYITGCTDAEGCFTTSIYADSRMSTKWQVKPIFKITLHNKDRKILEALQRTWGVGKIYKHGTDSIAYRVSSLKNLKVIINHFEKYPLKTQKLADYLLFKQSVALIEKKQHLTKEGLLELVGIKATLNWGLSEILKQSFPNIIPVTRPVVKSTEINDIYWLIGFVEGEGCFMVVIQQSKSKKTTHNVSLRFTITQHTRDSVLFESILNYLGCGRCYVSRNEVAFITSTFSDITSKIIPLFNKYPLLGTKKEDYSDFKKVAELVRSKDHLTPEGIEKIRIIQSNMNSKRIHS